MRRLDACIHPLLSKAEVTTSLLNISNASSCTHSTDIVLNWLAAWVMAGLQQASGFHHGSYLNLYLKFYMMSRHMHAGLFQLGAVVKTASPLSAGS
jgi:hypothetical protein